MTTMLSYSVFVFQTVIAPKTHHSTRRIPDIPPWNTAQFTNDCPGSLGIRKTLLKVITHSTPNRTAVFNILFSEFLG